MAKFEDGRCDIASLVNDKVYSKEEAQEIYGKLVEAMADVHEILLSKSDERIKIDIAFSILKQPLVQECKKINMLDDLERLEKLAGKLKQSIKNKMGTGTEESDDKHKADAEGNQEI